MSDGPDLATIARRIWGWCLARDFRGSDPYDGLNSRLLRPLLGRSRLLRLAVIQGVKRSPLDLRPLLRVPPGLNPKGAALLLHGASVWPGLAAAPDDRRRLGDLLTRLASRPDGSSGWDGRDERPGAAAAWAAAPASLPAAGWGYDFPWQSKAFLQPAFHPTVVCTSFVVDALAAAGDPAADAAMSAAAVFVERHLNRHEAAEGLCFSYSPGDRTRVYNASLFGARILAQASPLDPDREERRRELAAAAVDFVVARQAGDGSWLYGEADHWAWIDNLHTGFNLETIARIAEILGERRWDEALERGLDFYRRRLFAEDGTPLYYAHREFPRDAHSYAQGALTFLHLRDRCADGLAFADRILACGVRDLWDDRRGGFVFQRHRRHVQRSIHLRWSQAWMFRAICSRLALSDRETTP